MHKLKLYVIELTKIGNKLLGELLIKEEEEND